MRSAFLVLAHRSPILCKRLMRRLSAFGDVFIHVDLKQDLSEYLDHSATGRTGAPIPSTRRLDIRWGSFAMVQATLDLLAHARAVRDYDRYTLISGDSYPIKNAARIRDFLASTTDHISANDTRHDERRIRIEQVYAPDTLIGQIKAPFHERHLRPDDARQIAQAAALFDRRSAFIERTGYYIGSQWWSLTGRTIDKILRHVEEDAEFIQHFRFSSIPDEAFFQTAFMATSDDAARRRPGPVFSKWDSHPRPYEFTQPSDLALLDKARELFARKFGENADALLDTLDARLA